MELISEYTIKNPVGCKCSDRIFCIIYSHKRTAMMNYGRGKKTEPRLFFHRLIVNIDFLFQKVQNLLRHIGTGDGYQLGNGHEIFG